MSQRVFFIWCLLLSSLSWLPFRPAEATCNSDTVKIKIVNMDSSPIISIMSKNSGATDWNRLERIMGMKLVGIKIDPNDSQYIELIDSSNAILYDFVFVFGNGQNIHRDQINTCETKELKIRSVTPALNSTPTPAPIPNPAPILSELDRGCGYVPSGSKHSSVQVASAILRNGPGWGYSPVNGGPLLYGTNVIVIKIIKPWVCVAVAENGGNRRLGYINGYELTPPR